MRNFSFLSGRPAPIGFGLLFLHSRVQRIAHQKTSKNRGGAIIRRLSLQRCGGNLRHKTLLLRSMAHLRGARSLNAAEIAATRQRRRSSGLTPGGRADKPAATAIPTIVRLAASIRPNRLQLEPNNENQGRDDVAVAMPNHPTCSAATTTNHRPAGRDQIARASPGNSRKRRSANAAPSQAR